MVAVPDHGRTAARCDRIGGPQENCPRSQSEPQYRLHPAAWWLIGLIACAFVFWALFAITHALNT
jgi:hypothetical protein